MDKFQKRLSRKQMLIVVCGVLALLLAVILLVAQLNRGSGRLETDLNYANYSGTVSVDWRLNSNQMCVVELTADLTTESGLLGINDTIDFTPYPVFDTCTPDIVADLMQARLRDQLRPVPDWAKQGARDLIFMLRGDR